MANSTLLKADILPEKEVHVCTNIVKEDDLRAAQLRALKIFADAVSCTYGPMGGYTAYSMKDPNSNLKAIISNYTKDGFTVLKNVDVDKPVEALLKDEIRDICVQVIKKVGDGTTSAVLLSYFIFDGLMRLKDNGVGKRDIIKAFKTIIADGIKEIEANGHVATIDDIFNIALTSLDGNEEIANEIKKIYKKEGMDVFIDVAVSNTTETTWNSYTGMTYDSGYIDPAFINNAKDSTCELENPHIYVFESPIDTPDMIDTVKTIIEKEIVEKNRRGLIQQQNGEDVTVRAQPTVIICPFISRDANSYIDQLINTFNSVEPARRLPLCIVTNIDNMNQYLADIQAMTGAKFIKKYIDHNNLKKDKVANLAPTMKNITSFAGTAKKVIIDALSTRIIDPKMMFEEDGETYTEFFNNYLNTLQVTLDKYNETKEELVKIGSLKRRINILKANMVDFYVGGIGISDRDALRDSVEDAVLNCRSAAKEGVGYGGNFEGITAFNKINKKYGDERTKLHEDQEADEKTKYTATVNFAVSAVILNAYADLITLLYKPAFNDNSDIAQKVMAVGLTNKHCPYNVITGEFDGTVLTSIKTEPVMLDAIAKIISLLFNTNQFLVPDARFNIYEQVREDNENMAAQFIQDESENEDEESEPETEVVEEADEETAEPAKEDKTTDDSATDDQQK